MKENFCGILISLLLYGILTAANEMVDPRFAFFGHACKGPNGEESNIYCTYYPGDSVGDFKDWTVITGSVDECIGLFNPPYFESNYFMSIDLNGANAGFIEHVHPTVRNALYSFSFYYAGNSGCGNDVKKFVLVANDYRSTFSFDTTGKSNSNMGWKKVTIQFSGTSSSTTTKIQFYSLEDSACGPVLANFNLVTVNFLANGRFEKITDRNGLPACDPITTAYCQVNANDNAADRVIISSWNVSSGSVDVVNPPTWEPREGKRSIELSGVTAGVIKQTIEALPQSSNYILSFSMSGNPTGGSRTKTLYVTVTGNPTKMFIYDTLGRSPQNMGWSKHSFEFHPESYYTTVAFRSGDYSSYGPVIDDVLIERANATAPR